MRNKFRNGLIAAALALVPATTCLAATPSAAKTTKVTQARDRWPAETLAGQLDMVDAGRHLVVIQDASGVPFDLVVSPSTRIESSTGRVSLNQLSSDLNRHVSIRFIPEDRGDIARTINISQ